MKYLSTFEVAEKWGMSHRRVGILYNENRIPGAQRAGGRWIIPEDAEDRVGRIRIAAGVYDKRSDFRRECFVCMIERESVKAEAECDRLFLARSERDLFKSAKLLYRARHRRIRIAHVTLNRFHSGACAGVSDPHRYLESFAVCDGVV